MFRKVIEHLKQKEDPEYIDIELEFKRFLWNLGNQREKIPGHLMKILRHLYPGYKEERLHSIKQKILNNIK